MSENQVKAKPKPKVEPRPIPFMKMEDSYWICKSPRRADITRMKEAGVKTVVNLIAENEKKDPVEILSVYMNPAEAATASNEEGMLYREMPVYGFQLRNPYIARGYAEMIKDLPKPMMICCITGQRSAMLWGMLKAADPEADVEEIMDDALDYNQDIYPIEDGLLWVAAQAKKYPTPTAEDDVVDQAKNYCELMEKTEGQFSYNDL